VSKRYEFEVAKPYTRTEYVVAQIMTGSNRSNGVTAWGRPLVPELFWPATRHYASSKRARRREMAAFMVRGYFVREMGE
jgi:hypothetical protein